MTEDKAKRLVVASTVGAVLLIVILVGIMIYQLIAIGVETKKKTEYSMAIEEYNQLIEQGKDTLEARSQEWWIQRRAYELGYRFPDDVVLD